MGMLCYRPLRLTLLAEVYCAAGLPKGGLSLVGEATDLIEVTQERWFEAESHRVRGELLRKARDEEGAQNSFERGLAVAQRQGAKLWELRTALSLALLWRDQGKRAQARDLLGPIYGWFTEGFEAPDLKDARALLDELCSP
jgi:predicted ATPase